MQALLRRYRDLTVLVVVVLFQLVVLGSQVRGEEGAPLIHRWAVSAVVPFAKGFALAHDGTVGSLRELFVLTNARADNQRLKAERDRLMLENQFLKSELGTADRAKTLAAFQQRHQSKTIAARLIGSGMAVNTQTIFIDRGTGDGLKKGMAVITPDGIVGKVVAVFPAAAQVMLITDPAFAAGVVSGKNRLPGTLRGEGSANAVRVDYMPTESKVERDEWFYTSGDDRVFPRGLPVGRVTLSARGRDFRDVRLVPSGLERGLEEVLIVIEGVHELLPDEASQSAPPGAGGPGEVSQMLPPPNGAVQAEPAPDPNAPAIRTDADRLLERYRKIGEAQKHHFGAGPVPDFNAPITAVPNSTNAAASSPAGAPSTAGANRTASPAPGTVPARQ